MVDVWRGAVVVILALTTVAGAAGCGRDEFEDRTAVVGLGGSSETYDVTSCGRDGETVFVVARGPSGALVQAVLGLDADDEGVLDSSGITIDGDPRRDDTRLAAFGPESWARQRRTGAPPGEITSARLRGSRIQIRGDAVAVDAADRPQSSATTAVSIDARCDEQEKESAAVSPRYDDGVA